MHHSAKRIAWIDTVETIAIFFVVFYHSSLFIFEFKNTIAYIKTPLYFILTIFSTCVPLFFFANGYLLFQSSFTFKKHIARTLNRAALVLIWAPLTLLIMMPIKKEYFTLSEILNPLSGWRYAWNNHLWFLSALVCIYLVFPLLKVVYDSHPKVFLYFTVICAIFTLGNKTINILVTAVSAAFHWNTIYSDVNFFQDFNFLRGIYGHSFVYFCFGGIVYRYKDTIEHISSKKRTLAALLAITINMALLWLVGIMYTTAQGSIWDVVWSGYDTPFTFINVFCLFLLCLNTQTVPRWIPLVSKNTMGIYLLHMFFMAPLQEIVQYYPALQSAAGILLCPCFVCLICLLLSVLFNKIPGVRRLVH